jgi:hypothetical protein
MKLELEASPGISVIHSITLEVGPTPASEPVVEDPTVPSLTLEEAIEVILKGKPWKECCTCLGCGKRFYDLVKSTTPTELWSMKQGECLDCDGRGWVLRPIYKAALDVTGLETLVSPPPPTPRNVTIDFDGKNTYL